MINPNDLFNEYSQNATIRTKNSLQLVHDVCREQHENHKSKDFSIATIGKLVHSRGGPSEGAIRNKQGAKYRALISAWAQHVGGNETKKASANKSTLELALETISDPGLRTIALSIFAENKKLLRQVNLQRKELENTSVIDLRPKVERPEQVLLSPMEVFRLTEHEIDALREAVSDSKLESEGWKFESNGRISTTKGRSIYPPGYVSGLKKILSLL